MKPSFTPCFFSNRSLYLARRSITGFMSTSLNVVSMAAVFCASLSRRAMVVRRRVIFTRSSRASSAAATGPRAAGAGIGAGAVAGCGAGAAAGAACMILGACATAGRAIAALPETALCCGTTGAGLLIAASTSSFSTWPRRPLPLMPSAERPFSVMSLAAAGAGGGAPLPERMGAAPAGAGSVRGAGAAATAAGAGWAAGAAAALGASALGATAVASPMAPISEPTFTVSPGCAEIASSTPAAGAGTSIVTLSVSSSTTGSSAATASPTFLNHWPIVASVTLSPSAGTRMSVAIVSVSLLCESFFEELLQLRDMRPHQPRRRRGRGRATDIARPVVRTAHLLEHPVHIRLDERPGAHVLGLFLAPDDLGVLEPAELVEQGLGRERIKLLEPQQVHIVDPALLAILEQVVIDLARAEHDPADL